MQGFVKILYNQVAFALSIVGATFGVIMWISSPQTQQAQDLALIKQTLVSQEEHLNKIESNHMTHMQKAEEELVEQGKTIVEILTKLNDHINK